MRGQIQIDGWSHFRGHRLRPGLISNIYRHSATGWTAQEVYQGQSDRLLFLIIHDEKGERIGTCQSVKELP